MMMMTENNTKKAKSKRNIQILAAVLTAACLLAGCTNGSGTGGIDATLRPADPTNNIAPEQQAQEAVTLVDPSENQTVIDADFSITTSEGEAVEGTAGQGGTVYYITASGDYTVKGQLKNGQIVVSVPDTAADSGTVKLILSGASVSCDFGAPVSALSAEKVDVEATEGTYNIITDTRSLAAQADVAEDDAAAVVPDAAIFAECDLKLSGKGTLVVDANCDNGIKTKDDLTVKNITLKVTAPGNALKGNDSVSIESGNIILISTEGDGLKTSSTDLSSKGKQRGTVTVSGGQVDIYAAKDGISAAYDAVIDGSAVVNIFTASYSDYSGSSAAGSDMYLIVPKGSYFTSLDYYAYFYNGSGDFDGDAGAKWVKCTYETMVYSGRSASYYGLKLKAPEGYASVRFCTVNSGEKPSGSSVVSSTSGGAVNSSMNAYLISSVSSGSISGDWVMLSSGSGNSSKTTYSSKGIKAYNEIQILGGTINISCGDDGLHANNDEKLENGSYGAGNVTVSGGTLTVNAADDGMHADNVLTVSGGTVNIKKSHEGLEGNVINIAGGSTFVYGSDDGVNACRGASNPLVNITGGYLDVTTPSGDTDGIDSNGSITMSGGFVIVKGGSSQGGMAGSIDLDGTLKVTGGTVIALGGICETPGYGSVNTYISSGTSFQAGSYSLCDSSGSELASFTLAGNYSSVWIASDQLSLNGKYVLKRGNDAVLEWTQSSSTVGSGGQSGPGGPGGHGGWGGPGGRR